MRAKNPAMKLKLAFLGMVLLGLSSAVFGQYGFHIGARSELAASQRFNPAYLQDGEFSTFRISSSADGWVGNSDTPIKGLFAENGYITEETKLRMLDNMSGRVTLGGGYQFDLLNFNYKVNNWVFGLNISDRLVAAGQVNNPNTIGLILRGNGPYADTTVSDEQIFARMMHTREIGLAAATSFSDGKIKVGGRLGLLLGNNMIDARINNYSLYTGPLGSEIDLIANYQLNLPEKSSNVGFLESQGMGVSLDLGGTYEVNEKLRLSAAILDLGVVSWNAKQYQADVNINFEGVSISSLFADSIPEEIEAAVDSLQDLLLPDSSLQKQTYSTGMSIRLGGRYKIGNKGQLNLFVAYSPLKTTIYNDIPRVSAVYTHEVIDGLKLSGSLSGGGLQTVGFGAMASYRLGLSGDKMAIDFSLGGDDLLGFGVGSVGRGFSLFGGIGFSY